jgi:multidrug efflux pump
VFSGMLGVTFFGIFLTPVFFYVIQRYGQKRAGDALPVATPLVSAPPTGFAATVLTPQDRANGA